MTDVSDAELLGFLRGCLDDSETSEIERRLAADPHLAARLRELKTLCAHLDSAESYAPPAGLAERTCRAVALVGCGPRNAEDAPSPLPEPPAPSRSLSWLDALAAAAAVVLLAMLVFPAIEHARADARIAQCRENLHRLSIALGTYADQFDGFFPAPPQRDEPVVAGFYAPLLLETGYISAPTSLYCPASPPKGPAPSFAASASASECSASPELGNLSQVYGYTLGYVLHGEYRPVRCLNRSTYAVMADPPLEDVAGSGDHVRGPHGCRGRNVLFEDGHVSYLTCAKLPPADDNLFLNRLGHVAPGVDQDDSVVARGTTPITPRP
ncbi:anti-sigma factor [Thermostilla marina]